MKCGHILAKDHQRPEYLALHSDASGSTKFMPPPCFLVNILVGVHVELDRCDALVIIIGVTANDVLLVEVHVRVSNPLVHFVLGN